MWRYAAILLMVAGCSGDKARSGGDCTSTDDCAPGEVCVDNSCERVCRSDSDCGDGDICVSDICQTGTRDSGPVILSIDADGSEDTTAGHVAHRIDRRLYIVGESLEGSAVYLYDGTSQHELDICSSSNTRLEVTLPPDLAPGNHTLSVVTQGGQCDAALPTLQGEDGSPDTGNDIVAKINTAATTLIDSSKLTAVDAATLGGLSAGGFAPATHGHVGQYPTVTDGTVSTANPWFREGLDGWTVSSGSGSVVDTTSSPSGKAFANTDDDVAWIHSSTPIQVDPAHTYVLRGRFTNTTTSSSAGNIYLAVVLYDATGTLISGDGTWWYYAVNNYDAATTGPHQYQMPFGAYTNRVFPAGAATMAVGAVLNYDNGSAGNRIFEVTGLSIAPVEGPEWRTRQHIERYAAVCASMGAGYTSVAAVTPGDATVTMTGNSVCNNYVGNNGLTNWTCISVPYIYNDYINRDPTGRYFGTDVRPTWRPCATESGPNHGSTGNYPWLDPWTGAGRMMACCGY